jgi:hypothetical protein
MTDPLIWTGDDIVRFTYEPDSFDREWAWGWLRRHHLEEASRQVVRALRDPSGGVVATGIHIFASAPTAEARELIDEIRRGPDRGLGVQSALAELDHPGRPKTYDDSLDRAVERLSRERDELRREAPAMLRSRDLEPVLVALGALGNQQHQWATDILVDALPVLLTAGDPAIVWDTFDQLRDPRALPAIAAAWVPGERYIASMYARIHRLAGDGTRLPSGIARDAEQERRRIEAALARRGSDPAAAKLADRRLELRCTACGRTGDYEFAAEMLETVIHFGGAEKAGRKLPSTSIMTCKHCGVTNAYEVNTFSWISAAGGIEALKASRKKSS